MLVELLTPMSAANTALAAVVVWKVLKWLRTYVELPVAKKNPASSIYCPPYALPWVYHTFEVLKNVHRMYEWNTENAKAAQGRPVLWKMIGRPAVVQLTRPELFEDVQKSHFECFDKGPYLREAMEGLLGGGIFIADGENWITQRKVASNLFTARMLRESMSSTVHELLPVLHSAIQANMESETPIELTQLFGRFTMDAFAAIGFGVQLHCLGSEEINPFQTAFDAAQELCLERFKRPALFWKLQRWLNIGCEAELRRNVQVIDDLVFSIISRSLKQRSSPPSQTESKEKKRDLVSLFLDHLLKVQGDSAEFDPVLLRDVVLNFLMAGRDTTSGALTWFFYALSQNPQVERKIQDELRENLPELFDGKMVAPTVDQLQGLVYLDAAIKESLRLYPVVPSNVRQANRDVVLSDGTFIAMGTNVCFHSYVLARMEWVWGVDAKQYNPDRWIDPETGKSVQVSPFKFNVFLAGSRICLGMNLALLQIKMVASSLLSHFHLEAVPDQEIAFASHITLKMKHGFRVNAKPLRREPLKNC